MKFSLLISALLWPSMVTLGNIDYDKGEGLQWQRSTHQRNQKVLKQNRNGGSLNITNDSNNEVVMSGFLVDMTSNSASMPAEESSMAPLISNLSSSPVTFSPTILSSPNLSSSSNDLSLPFISRMGCPTSQRKLQFSISVDKFGKETTWKLVQLSTNNVVMSNGWTYSAFDEEVVETCVDAGYPEEQYELKLYDEVGDGICCANGDGSYSLSIEEAGGFSQLITGGSFKKTVMKHKISVRSKSHPLSSRDEEWLLAHNSRRQFWHKHYGKEYVPLKWSGELATFAKAYAEKLLDTCDDDGIVHDPTTAYGENMAKNKGLGEWGREYSSDKIVGRFVDREVEVEYPHNFHLTQVLWRATKYVGCGEASKEWNEGTCRIQICRYAKTGNCDMNHDTWLEKMLLDNSDCYPDCPPEGCF